MKKIIFIIFATVCLLFLFQGTYNDRVDNPKKIVKTVLHMDEKKEIVARQKERIAEKIAEEERKELSKRRREEVQKRRGRRREEEKQTNLIEAYQSIGINNAWVKEREMWMEELLFYPGTCRFKSKKEIDKYLKEKYYDSFMKSLK